jgi:hypothetical protein
VNVFCAVNRTQVYRPFSFAKTAIMGHVYLNMQEHFPVTQLDVNSNVYIPPMPVDLPEFHDRTLNSIALVDVTFLNELWDNISPGCLLHNLRQPY